MGLAHTQIHRARRALTATASCVALAGCMTAEPGAAGRAALFKAEVGDISGGVAPGPHSVWYVQSDPAAYVKMGFATAQPDRSRGLRGSFARHFGRRAADTEPTAIAAAGLRLPVPSRVQVTNVASGQVITVRVDDKAAMGQAVLQLSPEAARALGVAPGKPLLVRMRYLAPVVAYNAGAGLRYAAQRPAKPAAPAPVVLAQANPPPVAPPPAAAPAPAIIRVKETGAAPLLLRAALPAPPVMRPALDPPAPRAAPAADVGFHVQAGAFASLDNARRAVGMLALAGPATIAPMKHGTATLYRVVLSGPKDAADADRLRARVVQAGFPDARVIRPL